MPANQNTVISQTRAWLQDVVIKLNLCPFAEHPFSHNKVEYIVCNTAELQQQLETLASTCSRMDENPAIETSLIIYTDPQLSFEPYLDLLELANALLDDLGYQGIYQLASFHPDYQFEGSNIDDASNFTNRSPYPMLHLIRENSIEQALKNYPDAENIPDNNIATMNRLGTERNQQTLNEILNRDAATDDD